LFLFVFRNLTIFIQNYTEIGLFLGPADVFSRRLGKAWNPAIAATQTPDRCNSLLEASAAWLWCGVGTSCWGTAARLTCGPELVLVQAAAAGVPVYHRLDWVKFGLMKKSPSV